MAVNVYLIAGLVALATGTFASALGIGGGLVLVPVLTALGVEPIQAIAVSSFAIVLGSSMATYRNHCLERESRAEAATMGRIEWPAALVMGGPMLLVSYLGSQLASRLPERVLVHVFTGAIVLALGMLEYNRRVVSGHALQTYEPMPRDLPALTRFALTGAAGGVITGMLGLGGGMVMVPLQVLFFRAHMKTAIKNAQAVIVLGAMAATLGHYANGHLPVLLALVVGCGMMAGAPLGAAYLKSAKTNHLRLAFSGVLVVTLARSLLFR
jgi:uncharacterized protein